MAEVEIHRSGSAGWLRLTIAIAAIAGLVAALDPGSFLATFSRKAPAALPEYFGSSIPQYSPFTATLAASTVPWLVAIAVLLTVAFRLAVRLRAVASELPSLDKGSLAEGECGRTAIEFLLLLPLVLSILLLVLQIALMVQAKFVVNYAAFCAVRSAIVWIPAEKEGEARNRIEIGNTSSEKMQKIWRAASLACVPISPHHSSGLADRTGIEDATQEQKDAVDRIATYFPSNGDDGVAESFKQRIAYAFDSGITTIEIVPESGSHNQSAGEFGDHDLVTVRVTHRFYLGVPLANRLLGTSFGVGPGSGFYYPIVEQYTLLNEGEPLGS
ncbi:MAG: pilus assembly protein [Acidobacteria bacterium]|nr:pilus assembly protein [Acidobacteriota bacterium]